VKALKAELAELRQQTEDLLQIQTMRPDATLNELKRKLDSLNQQQQTLTNEISSLTEKMQSSETQANSEQVARNVEQMQRELGDVEAELKQLTDGDFISFQSAANMPDVWLIDVRNESAEFLRLQNPTKIERFEFDAEISTTRLATQLASELRRKKAGTSVVMLLRPSAAGRGSELLMQMQAAGYRVALELLDSETQIVQSTETSR
jgi:chromosome segregation ATPase